MDTNLKIQTAAVSDAESAFKQDWHAPVITRIDIKRTMHFMGSGADAGIYSTPK